MPSRSTNTPSIDHFPYFYLLYISNFITQVNYFSKTSNLQNLWIFGVNILKILTAQIFHQIFASTPQNIYLCQSEAMHRSMIYAILAREPKIRQEYVHVWYYSVC
jgi:hypothetical protein